MEDLEIRPGVVIPGWEMWMTVARSGGPGGQHANKTSTKVVLYWNISATTALNEAQRGRVEQKLANRINADGQLLVEADDTRSQHRNRELARARLAELVNDALKVHKRRIHTNPSQAARKRRLEEKRQRAQIKDTRRGPDPKDY
jgi:ribosome-associated protein